MEPIVSAALREGLLLLKLDMREFSQLPQSPTFVVRWWCHRRLRDALNGGASDGKLDLGCVAQDTRGLSRPCPLQCNESLHCNEEECHVYRGRVPCTDQC
jgi:hypothetical protein